ncbi:hypothetical protein EDC04DRAFT_2608257 [Pisolithus marmoratus]|nr:hypothetical protein EDC04DRAFT_2608257 [Pisolithus marmoratus]
MGLSQSTDGRCPRIIGVPIHKWDLPWQDWEIPTAVGDIPHTGWDVPWEGRDYPSGSVGHPTALKGFAYSIGISQCRGKCPAYHWEVPQHWETSPTPDGMSQIPDNIWDIPRMTLGNPIAFRDFPCSSGISHGKARKGPAHLWDIPRLTLGNPGSSHTPVGFPMGRLGKAQHINGNPTPQMGYPKYWVGSPQRNVALPIFRWDVPWNGRDCPSVSMGCPTALMDFPYSTGISHGQVGKFPGCHREFPQQWGTSHNPVGLPMAKLGKAQHINGKPHTPDGTS